MAKLNIDARYLRIRLESLAWLYRQGHIYIKDNGFHYTIVNHQLFTTKSITKSLWSVIWALFQLHLMVLYGSYPPDNIQTSEPNTREPKRAILLRLKAIISINLTM